jgi:hypothetical protein
VTSSENEYVAIDDLEIRGSAIGNMNFSGIIDSVAIYERSFSEEQIYQNYLCTKDGGSSISAIVSEETIVGQYWSCVVTPVHETGSADSIMSNGLLITNYGGG